MDDVNKKIGEVNVKDEIENGMVDERVIGHRSRRW